MARSDQARQPLRDLRAVGIERRLRPPPSAPATRSRSRCRRRPRALPARSRRSGADRAGRGRAPGRRASRSTASAKTRRRKLRASASVSRQRGDLLRQRSPGVQGIERQAAVDAARQDDSVGQRLTVARRDGQPPLRIQVVRVAPQKHRSPPTTRRAIDGVDTSHPVRSEPASSRRTGIGDGCIVPLIHRAAPLIPTFPHSYPQRAG